MKTIITLCFFLLINFSLNAQNVRIKFEHISLKNGLSQSSIYDILQDDRGFMWFATEDGLNKYDGYTIKIYRNNRNNNTSISDNFINVLFEDSKKRLWIGTRSGSLNRYNKLKDQFIRVVIKKEKKTPSIQSICEDTNNFLWIGTNLGLFRLNTENNKTKFFPLPKEYSKQMSIDYINQLVFDNQKNKLWIATHNGLLTFNIKSQKFHLYTKKNSELTDNKIKAINIDSKNDLWVGTGNGLNLFNKKNKKFVSFLSKNNNSNNITSIAEDHEEILWIGTSNSGINRFDIKTKTFTNYTHDAAEQSSLSSNKILSIYQDQTNILWVGTSLGGINKWNRAAEDLNVFRHNPYDSYSLSSNQVRSIYQDKKGGIWIGTVDGGLNHWITKENKFIHYKSKNGDTKTLSHNHIRTILEDSKGNLWIGTDGGGINQLDTKKEKFIRYPFSSEIRDDCLSGNRVWKIFEDSKKHLWVATFGGGLNLFFPKENKFKTFKNNPNDKNTISSDLITTIFEDNKGRLWIGTYGGGLNLWNETDASFKSYKYNPKNKNSICDNRIYCIIQDKNNTLWIGVKGGLNKFIPEKGEFVRYTEKNGLPNDVILGILEDKKSNNLWISTNSGLSRFNTKTEKARNYDVRDGLQSNEFLVGAFCKTTKGEMLFGGINGFNAFFPENIKDNPHKPEIVITKFKVFNQEIPLDTNISEKNIINLNHKQHSFSFDFVALDYIFPEKNQYAFKLEGVDNKWNYVKDRRFASYTNVTYGTYIFKVKGSNNDEVWNETGTQIIIHIEPAFYQKRTNQVIFIFLIVLIISLIIWLRFRNIQRQKIKLEQQVVQRTFEIREKNVELEQRNEEIEAQKDQLIEQRDQIIVQKKEITDSIHYAKRIQKASLPASEYLSEIFKEHFIFFKPKDIVSGDFFWATKKDNTIIIAAADCTGHGVPGAFMSMFGVSFLNKIINEKSIVNPTDILERLRENVINSLKQTGEIGEAKDGMDIALCCIDLDNKILKFAGANNPLYLVRNQETVVYKGDKMPIAHYERMDAFKTQTINLEKDDIFYIFSDGYADQFGGEKGKKFKYGKFRKLLIEISNKPMSEQKELLSKAFYEWKGNLEQVDDIVVIGVKL